MIAPIKPSATKKSAQKIVTLSITYLTFLNNLIPSVKNIVENSNPEIPRATCGNPIRTVNKPRTHDPRESFDMSIEYFASSSI